MVALPTFKFIFLGIRQLTRPIAKQIVSHATTRRGLTYSACIGLGRVSLGLSGVIAEWSRKEELKRIENQKRLQETEGKRVAEAATKSAQEAVKAADNDSGGKPKAPINAETKRIMETALAYADRARSGETAAAASSSPGGTATAATPETTTAEAPKDASSSASAAAAAAEEKEHVVSFPTIVTPRSRSLLEPIMYGPNPPKEEPYDASVFVDPAKRTPGAVMRIFITKPYQSAWYVFKTAFLAPFPEKRLVDAGADFMIELIAYTILATLLFIELRQASRSATAKEERVNARLDAIEEKINELVRSSAGAASSNVEQLPPVPELKIKGRLDSLNYLAKATLRLAETLVVEPLVSVAGGGAVAAAAEAERKGTGQSSSKKPKGSAPTEEERAAAAASAAAAAPVYSKKSLLPKAPPPDPQAKRSKHDESNAMKAELARTLAQEPKAT